MKVYITGTTSISDPAIVNGVVLRFIEENPLVRIDDVLTGSNIGIEEAARSWAVQNNVKNTAQLIFSKDPPTPKMISNMRKGLLDEADVLIVIMNASDTGDGKQLNEMMKLMDAMIKLGKLARIYSVPNPFDGVK